MAIFKDTEYLLDSYMVIEKLLLRHSLASESLPDNMLVVTDTIQQGD